MMPKYIELVDDDLATHIGDELCNNLKNMPSIKTCNLAASFILAFKEKIDKEQVEEIYDLLKNSKNGARAAQIVNKAYDN